jgi:hypothetical protein
MWSLTGRRKVPPLSTSRTVIRWPDLIVAISCRLCHHRCRCRSPRSPYLVLPESLFLRPAAWNSCERWVADRERELLQIRDIDKREVRSVSLFPCRNREWFWHVRSQVSARSGQITTLKAKTSKLTDFIRDVLSKLYSKHTLNLLDWRIKLHIHMTGHNLLNPSLAAGSTSLCSSVANTCMHWRDSKSTTPPPFSHPPLLATSLNSYHSTSNYNNFFIY